MVLRLTCYHLFMKDLSLECLVGLLEFYFKGEEVLLKAIAFSMHVYVMYCFKLPKATYAKLTSDLWCNSREEKKKNTLGKLG